MNLFEVIPEKYFSIFNSKNRFIFAEALLTLIEMLETDENIINKNDFLKALKDKDKKSLEEFDLMAEEDVTLDDSIIIDNLSAKASFIVRRLEETGWINIAMDPEKFEETIILPPFSIIILKAFKDVISDEESPYLSLVHATYSELKLEDDERDDLMYVTLLKCYENTKRLKVELITLFNSIRIFQNKLGKMFETNDVLRDFFDIYKTKINDRYYHPLKTFDSVIKFKRPIIQILEKWLLTKEIREKLIQQAAYNSRLYKRDEIERDIITKINYITDTYSTINELISRIDKENSNYTKSSTNKILYLNNTDKTIKGHLENIIKSYAKSFNSPRLSGKIISKMSDAIYLYDQGFIDPESITFPINRRLKEDGSPLEIIDFDVANEELMKDFLEATKNIYTNEKIFAFMESCFGNNNSLPIEEMPLNDMEAFICLIFATVKKDDENCFYEVELIDDKKIINNCFLVPHFLFTRKESI